MPFPWDGSNIRVWRVQKARRCSGRESEKQEPKSCK